jgi:hypothetical protein
MLNADRNTGGVSMSSTIEEHSDADAREEVSDLPHEGK